MDAATTTDAPAEPDAMVVLGPCEGDSIAIGDLSDCFIAAQCEWLVTCIAFAPTVQACINQINEGGALDLDRIIESTTAGRTIYSGTAAATCLATLDTATCTEQPGENCNDVFVGTIAEEGLCYLGEECSGIGADCRHDNCDDQCCAGTCLDAAPLGGDCSTRSCHDGDECVRVDGSIPEYQCYSGEQGIACTADYHCDSGLYCGPSLFCVPALTVNVGCDGNSQCLDPLTCVGENANAGTCRAVDTVGATCDYNCDGDLFCNNTTGGPTGICANKLGVNEICGSDSHCQPQLFCNNANNQCSMKPGLNMSCQNYSCSPGLFCTSELPGEVSPGTCSAPRVAASSCNSSSHCATGICNYGTKLCEAYLSCYT